jgi:stage II sporulation SpoAA-like protein
MIEILPAPDHVVALRLTGTLTADDYDHAVKETETKLQQHRRIGVYVDMAGFDDMTAEAAAKHMPYSRIMLGAADRFPRKAVVTDKQWVRILIGALDPLASDSESRAFGPGAREKAMAWASEIPHP